MCELRGFTYPAAVKKPTAVAITAYATQPPVVPYYRHGLLHPSLPPLTCHPPPCPPMHHIPSAPAMWKCRVHVIYYQCVAGWPVSISLICQRAGGPSRRTGHEVQGRASYAPCTGAGSAAGGARRRQQLSPRCVPTDAIECQPTTGLAMLALTCRHDLLAL